MLASGPDWVRAHVDLLRIAGVAVAALAALLLSSWAGLLVVVVVLAGYQLLLTAVGRRFRSDPAGGAAPHRG